MSELLTREEIEMVLDTAEEAKGFSKKWVMLTVTGLGDTALAYHDAADILKELADPKWEGITARDWDNGAIRDAFDSLQKRARKLLEELERRLRRGGRSTPGEAPEGAVGSSPASRLSIKVRCE